MAKNDADQPTMADLLQIINELKGQVEALSVAPGPKGEQVDIRGRYLCPEEQLFIGGLQDAQKHRDEEKHTVVDRFQGVRV